MKRNIIKLLSLFALVIFIANCDETEDFDFLPTERNFEIISPTDGASLILDRTNEQNIALTIVWSDNVSGSGSYSIEMAMDEAFTSPIVIGNSSNNTFSLAVEELNALLLDSDVPAFEEATIYFRVSGGEFSDIIKLVLSSYPESNPVILSPDGPLEIVLSDITEDEIALTVEWDDPDFSEDTATTINYYVETALAGTNFDPIETLAETQERMLTFTHERLNDAALNLGFVVEESAIMRVRVRSIIETASGDLERISDYISITVTPYETALPPILYGVGAGMPDAGWGWASPIEFPLQGTKYSGNVNLSPENDGNFRFFLQPDWNPDSYNYPWFEARGYTIDENLVNANDGDSNFQFIGTAGEYFLEIDTTNKTITLGPPVSGPNCEYDQLWLVGAGIADAGWSWDSPVELPCTGNGIYTAAVTFANDAFRFFAQQDWNPTSFNYPYYESAGYTIDANFENANDGDSNFRFIGTPGDYLLTLNDVSKTITLEPISCEYDQLWLVGAGIADAGWSWDSPVDLPCTGTGVYSGQVNFANDSFRFFAQQDWNPTSFNYPYYENEGYTIDGNFENANDGDSNFRFIGTPGTYTLTLDTINKTITLVQVITISCEYDQLWLVGAGIADAGWSWDSPVDFPCTGNGVYSAEVNFANDAFRFFAQQDWNPTSFNYPYYENDGYTIDANFENANDGDSNFRFIGTPGTYTLTLDTVNKTITLE